MQHYKYRVVVYDSGNGCKAFRYMDGACNGHFDPKVMGPVIFEVESRNSAQAVNLAREEAKKKGITEVKGLAPE